MPARKQSKRQLAHNIKTARARSHVTATQNLQQMGYVRLTLGLVSAIYRADAAYILGPSRGQQALSTSRQVMHYLVHICFGVNYTELATMTNRDRTSIAHACQRVEDMRDDPKIDKALFFAEMALADMAQHTCPLGDTAQDNEPTPTLPTFPTLATLKPTKKGNHS